MSNQEEWREDRIPSTDVLLEEVHIAHEHEEVLSVDAQLVTTTEDSRQSGWMDFHAASMAAWHVTVRYSINHYPAHIQECTVIQIIDGGISGGDGWGLCRRWVIGTMLDRQQLDVVAPLLEAGKFFSETFRKEL